MRDRAYSLFEIVAWPALAWCVIEVALRAATGTTSGILTTTTMGIAAASTVWAGRWRRRDLAASPAPIRDP